MWRYESKGRDIVLERVERCLTSADIRMGYARGDTRDSLGGKAALPPTISTFTLHVESRLFSGYMEEISEDLGDMQVGLSAHLMSFALRPYSQEVVVLC